MRTIISKEQFEVGAKLARAYGHKWVLAWDAAFPNGLPPGFTLTKELVREVEVASNTFSHQFYNMFRGAILDHGVDTYWEVSETGELIIQVVFSEKQSYVFTVLLTIQLVGRSVMVSVNPNPKLMPVYWDTGTAKILAVVLSEEAAKSALAYIMKVVTPDLS